MDTANYEPKDEAHFEYSWQWAYKGSEWRGWQLCHRLFLQRRNHQGLLLFYPIVSNVFLPVAKVAKTIRIYFIFLLCISQSEQQWQGFSLGWTHRILIPIRQWDYCFACLPLQWSKPTWQSRGSGKELHLPVWFHELVYQQGICLFPIHAIQIWRSDTIVWKVDSARLR